MVTLPGYNHIHYRRGYKYQLAEEFRIQTDIKPASDCVMEFITLRMDGLLIIRKGYAWDGPSGPTFDTKDFMRGSLVHDAIYQLIGEGLILRTWKVYADESLSLVCGEDGMWKIRQWWVYQGVDKGGSKTGSIPKPVLTAP